MTTYIFPTDTVYGIGASLADPDGIKEIYKIKNRNPQKPTAILLSDRMMMDSFANLPNYDEVKILLDMFWPGALTLIVKRKYNSIWNAGLELICGEIDTIGIRMPNHGVTQKLIKKLGAPLVASSANKTEEPAPFTLETVSSDLLSSVDSVISGECIEHVASTIVDITVHPFRIVREGSITKKDIIHQIPTLNLE